MRCAAARDPLDLFEKRVVADGLIDEPTLRAIDGEVLESIAAAVGFAEQSPFPGPESMLTDVYVNG